MSVWFGRRPVAWWRLHPHEEFDDAELVTRTAFAQFAILMGEVSGREECQAAVDRAAGVLQEKFELGGEAVFIKASFELRLFPEDAPSLEELFVVAGVDNL